MKKGRQNAAFIGDDGHATTDFQRPATGDDEKFRDNNSSIDFSYGTQHDRKFPLSLSISEETTVAENQTERDTWGNGLEFLMSCIAMSIGLGNVWRFPFTAYENGGGVFLIPYIIVLFLVGKPFYYLEMIMGQFCSRSSVKIWSAGVPCSWISRSWLGTNVLHALSRNILLFLDVDNTLLSGRKFSIATPLVHMFARMGKFLRRFRRLLQHSIKQTK